MSATTRADARSSIWYVAVGFGPCILPGTVSRRRYDVDRALAATRRRDKTGWTLRNSIIQGYATRAQARAGDISDDIGQHGRVI